MLNKKEGSKYVVIGIVFLLVLLSILILEPFISVLLLSALLAFIFHPIYKWLLKYVKSKHVSASITTFLIILIIAAPLLIVSYIVLNEILITFQSGLLVSLGANLGNLLGQSYLANYLPIIINEGLKFLTNTATGILLSNPKHLLNTLILIFSTFFLLVTGEDLVKKIEAMLPFKNKKELMISLKNTIKAIVYGFFVIGIIGFLIALIGLKILGIPAYALLALLMGILILIPGIGSTLIYIPLAIYYGMTGNHYLAFGLLVLGFIISMVETFGRPYIVGKKADINPVTIIFGIFGGLAIFGAVGLIIGPVILTITFSLIEGFTKK